MKLNQLLPLYKPLYAQASFYMIIAAGFFFLSYLAANTYSASLDFVPSIFYGWEKYIPFMPWTIIPYWTMDLLYGISFFLCTSKKELKVHTARLMCASFICCLLFVIFPLSCSTPIPPVKNSLLNYLFFGSNLVATSFNQAPSLHIALAWLVCLAYCRHTKGLVRLLFAAWFVLIGLSVLFCYQHHFIDIPTGFFTGILISYLLPLNSYERQNSPDIKGRIKLALLYLAGSIILAAAAFRLQNAAFFLLWPAAALFAVAMAYAHWGTAVFQKNTQGEVSVSAKIILLPYTLSAWLSKKYFTSELPPYCRISKNLYLGSFPQKQIKQDFLIDMTAEFDSSNIKCKGVYAFARMDLLAQTPQQINQAAQKAAQIIKQGSLLICCALGLGRSAVIAAAALILLRQAKDTEQALALIKKARPQIVLTENHITNLQLWYKFYTIKRQTEVKTCQEKI